MAKKKKRKNKAYISRTDVKRIIYFLSSYAALPVDLPVYTYTIREYIKSMKRVRTFLKHEVDSLSPYAKYEGKSQD